MISAAISERQENAQPCLSPPGRPGSAAGSRMCQVPRRPVAPRVRPARRRSGGTWSTPETRPLAMEGTAPSRITATYIVASFRPEPDHRRRHPGHRGQRLEAGEDRPDRRPDEPDPRHQQAQRRADGQREDEAEAAARDAGPDEAEQRPVVQVSANAARRRRGGQLVLVGDPKPRRAARPPAPAATATSGGSTFGRRSAADRCGAATSACPGRRGRPPARRPPARRRPRRAARLVRVARGGVGVSAGHGGGSPHAVLR